MCAAAMQPRKVALTIGNNNYEKSQLKNCVNDANDLRDALEKIGFIVTSKINLGSEQMEREIDNFADSLTQGDFVFFFFAGHGIQWEDQNYLIPCDDMKVKDEYDLKYRAINAQRFLGRLSSRKPHVIVFFLDCCRNYSSPSMARGQTMGGLAQMSAPAGSVIGFACAAGKTAGDVSSNGRNGIFTKHILEHMTKPGEEILMLLVDIANGVSTETNEKQVPYMTGSLTQRNICFVPSTNSTSTTPKQPPKATTAAPQPKLDQMKAVPKGPEFRAGKHEHCEGRLCANCGKCRDWRYTGDLTSWHWIQNVNNWKENDWQRYSDGKYWESFEKRSGATCRDCLCDDNRQN